MKKSYIMYAMTVLLLWIPLIGNAQDRIITGTVTSASDQIPLMGATILIKGTSKGTQTDFDGNFSIEAPKGATLIISFVGFATQNILVENQTIINVILQEEFNALDEVVVTGYATQQRNTMATSVSKLNTKVLESASRSNVATSLQGTIAGLQVTQSTGQPGATPVLVLRGGTQWGGNGSPLILIDGVPGSFFALNSDDIESIEVLKDAASTAIYGARAANGVVLISTKKGKSGRSNISFKSKLSINKRREDPMQYLGAADYVKFNRMAVKNSQMVRGTNWLNQFLTGNNAAATGNNTTNSIYTTMILNDSNRHLLNYPGWQTIDDPVNPGTALIFQENKMSDLIYQNSYTNDYTLSFDGGNDKGNYYLGLGYLDDKGLVFGSHFKRYSGTLSASYNITDNFKSTANIVYAHSNFNKPFDNIYNIFQRNAGIAPTSRIYNNNLDGSLSNELQPGTYLGFGNPLYYRDKFVRTNLEQRITSSVQFDWKFLPNFNYMVRGSYFSVNNTDEGFNKAYLNSGSLNTARVAFANYDRILRNQITSVISYKKNFLNKHNLNALVGHEYFRENRFNLNASTRLSPTDLIYTMNVGPEIENLPSSSKTSYAINSYFGQLNYDFDNKYLFGLTFRKDGTSRLGNEKYDFFPGISSGWNVHNESFYKESSINQFINSLKPRISYGVNGNIETLSNFGTYGVYGQMQVYNSQTGYANTGLPLLDLKWERSTTLNFGVDLGLFNNRATIIADYFIRDVIDKHSNLTLPLWTGFTSITTNNGTLRNKGLELEFNVKAIANDDIKWNIGGTFFTVKNYAKTLPNNGVTNNRQDGTEIYDPATGETKYVGGLQEGKRNGYDLITAYVFDGVYQTQDQIDADAGRIVDFAYRKDTRFLGDSRWKDLNGDNIIDYRDRVVIGRTTPDFIGGLTSDLSIKNFNLYVKTDYAVGHYLANGRRIKGIAQTQGNQNGPIEIRDSWTPENTTSNIPRFDLVDQQRNHLAGGGDQGSLTSGSSRLWEKGDYWH